MDLDAQDIIETLFITPVLPIMNLLQEIYVYDVGERYIFATVVLVNMLLWALYIGLIFELGVIGLILSVTIFALLSKLGLG